MIKHAQGQDIGSKGNYKGEVVKSEEKALTVDEEASKGNEKALNDKEKALKSNEET